MGRLFGNGDVRGIANTELSPLLAYKLGRATGYVLSKGKEKPVFLIGKDTRLSGDMLEDAMAAGFMSNGSNVIKVGVLPTPAIAYLVKVFGADAGIVISASHNPYEFNGIKFYNKDGFKMDDAFEDEVETILLRDIDINNHISGDRIGKCLEA
ncbi:MAG: phosphoglucosamine mutase, partial [Bacillota bacterium]|nr:phosphoglucosamine mutase [Bacillota bacterium]